MSELKLQKIVSGGQTGVDRAAMDVAIFLQIDHGGWCPRDRRAEDGMIPATYQLTETESRDYAVRTEQNVIDSDGTLIVYRERMTGGTDLTRRMAIKHNRPCHCIDLEQINSTAAPDAEDSIEAVIDALHIWIAEHGVQVLNVAGPRESTSPGIAEQSERFLSLALQRFSQQQADLS